MPIATSIWQRRHGQSSTHFSHVPDSSHEGSWLRGGFPKAGSPRPLFGSSDFPRPPARTGAPYRRTAGTPRLAVAAGLTGDWSGRSLRRDFATAARAAGHDPLEIARVGGWSDGSRVLARYMDDVDRVKNSPLVGIGL
ncbi:hypothetical protein ACH5AO_29085 [Streptomyces sp. NPDC018964]|uniref:hypothetical protein n=1 Tax=unclassified Streptomyces TaxID=2593676 RepID=UPI0037BB993C